MAGIIFASETAAKSGSGGMPQFDFSTWGSQIFWLVVTFGVMYFLLSRFILPKIGTTISQRSDRIADDLDAASQMQREAEAAEAEYERQLADARAKAHNIAATTRTSVEAEINSEIEAADAESARQAEAAEVRISEIRAKALRNVDDVAANVAEDIVSAISPLKTTAAKAKAALGKA